MRALIAIGLVAGCSSDAYLVVTVDARPAVHDAATLSVTLGNNSATLMRQLPIGANAFPMTFSVDAPGRSGELDLTVEADDAGGLPVGLGSAAVTVGTATADIKLDSTDFGVNTDYAMDQYLSFDYDSDGLQLTAAMDGSWTVGFRDNCNMTGSCNVYARRFDAKGAPVHTVAAAGTNSFTLTTTLTDSFTDPAMVTTGMTTIALWNSTDASNAHAVACRAIDPMGDDGSGQLSLTTDNASIVSAATLSNNNMAVVWELGYGITPNASIRTIIAKPDCTTLVGAPVTVSTTAATTMGPTSPHVATNGANALYAWIVDGDVYVREANSTAQFSTPADVKILTHSASFSAQTVRLAAAGAGYALVVRWVGPMSSAPGKIELFQLSSTGAVMGTAALVTDQSRSDFTSGYQAPSVAVRASDGAILVAWQQCDANGTVDSCDIYGRMVRPNSTTSGQPFILSSDSTRDQLQPSVVSLPGPDGAFAAVWTDTSHDAPDQQGQAVRGRILYPAYDPNGSN